MEKSKRCFRLYHLQKGGKKWYKGEKSQKDQICESEKCLRKDDEIYDQIKEKGDNVLLYQSICKNKSERKDENRIRKSLKYEKSKSQVGGGAILYTTELYTRIKKKFVLKNHAELYNHSSAWSKCCRQHNRSAYHK